MSSKKKSAKAIRNEAKRIREMPTDKWLTHIGFTAEDVAKMQADSSARLAHLVKK